MEVITITVVNAIGEPEERAIWIRNADNEEIVHPFPSGADVGMLPNVLGSVGDLALKAGC